MSSQRLRIRVALALFAFGVLGTSLVFASLHRDNDESIFDVIGPDVVAGATARDQLQFAEAERHFRRVVDLTQPLGAGPYDQELHASSLVWLGEVLEREGRVGEAERHYKTALRITNSSGNPFDESRVAPLSHLKNLYASAEDTSRAEEFRTEIDSIVSRVEPIHLSAIVLQRSHKQSDRSLLADKLMKLANLYYERGESQRSEPLYAEAFAIRSKNPKTSTDNLLKPLLRMGMAKVDADEDAAATAIFKETLAVREAQYGPNSPVLIKNLYNLGMLAYRQDRLEEADSLFSRALSIEEERLGLDHPFSAPILASLADCNRERGRFQSARAYQMRVVEIRERVYGRDSRSVASGLLALAEIEGAAGDRAAAREVCTKALEATTKASGGLDPLTINCRSALRRFSRYEPVARS